jgi:hypothetical protein
VDAEVVVVVGTVVVVAVVVGGGAAKFACAQIFQDAPLTENLADVAPGPAVDTCVPSLNRE